MLKMSVTRERRINRWNLLILMAKKGPGSITDNLGLYVAMRHISLIKYISVHFMESLFIESILHAKGLVSRCHCICLDDPFL